MLKLTNNTDADIRGLLRFIHICWLSFFFHTRNSEGSRSQRVYKLSNKRNVLTYIYAAIPFLYLSFLIRSVRKPNGWIKEVLFVRVCVSCMAEKVAMSRRNRATSLLSFSPDNSLRGQICSGVTFGFPAFHVQLNIIASFLLPPFAKVSRGFLTPRRCKISCPFQEVTVNTCFCLLQTPSSASSVFRPSSFPQAAEWTLFSAREIDGDE